MTVGYIRVYLWSGYLSTIAIMYQYGQLSRYVPYDVTEYPRVPAEWIIIHLCYYVSVCAPVKVGMYLTIL